MKDKIPQNKVQNILIILGFLQLLLILIVIINRAVVYLGIYNDGNIGITDYILVFALVCMVFSIYFTAKEIGWIYANKSQSETQVEMLKNIEKLNQKMREQRHEFLNHVQIVYSLIEMQEYHDAIKYLDKVYGEIDSLNKFIKTSITAVNALLQAKYTYAERKGIKFVLNICSNLDKINMSSWELCRILGNLIDNSLYETENFGGKKETIVEMTENISSYFIRVKNTGNTIKKEDIKNIFKEGFSTKKEHGEGMGLFIVKQICDKYNCIITVNSENNLTEFKIEIPK